MKVCFLLTHVPNPRINKRIDTLRRIADTKVICTRRASQDIWEPSQDVEHFIFDIDLPSATHMLKRYIISQDFQRKALLKLEEIKPDVIYAEGMDPLIIAEGYKQHNSVKIIFEVADLRESYIVKPSKWTEKLILNALLRKEKKIFGAVDYLIVTSPKFYDAHFYTLISRDRMLYIPNMPNQEAFMNYKRKEKGPFTIGFIGGIRYLMQMKLLVDAANEIGADVLFAGAGGTISQYEEIQRYCEGMNNVKFTGKYNYDSEIAGIYGKVDTVFAVYDADNPNVCIALPNKLYESIICELPIIVAKGTYLSELVDEWGVGVSVNHKSKQEYVDTFRKLKDDAGYYQALVERCKVLKDSLINTGWKDQLAKLVE